MQKETEILIANLAWMQRNRNGSVMWYVEEDGITVDFENSIVLKDGEAFCGAECLLEPGFTPATASMV
jgi:hypothetical protein